MTGRQLPYAGLVPRTRGRAVLRMWFGFAALAAFLDVLLCWSISRLDALLAAGIALIAVAYAAGRLAARPPAGEERCFGVFDRSAIGMMLTGLDGRFLRVNDAFCRLLGYSRDELLALTFMDVTHPDDLAGNLEGARQVRAGVTDSYATEKRYRRKDGATLWAALSVSSLRAADGTALHYICQVIDITARKATEETLRASDARLRTVVNNAPVILFGIDRAGRYTLTEGRGLAMLGSVPNRLVGRSLFEEYPDLTAVHEAVQRALSGEENTTRATLAGHIFETHYVPERDAVGNVAGVIGVATAVTERVRVEEDLRASEARFDAFMDHTPAVAYMKDQDGRFVYVNAACERLLGVTRDAMRGTTDADWFPSEAAAQNQAHDRAVLASEQPMEVLETVPIAGGEIHHWISYKFPVATGGAMLLGGISIDVTTHKHLEDALEQSNRDLARSNVELEQFAYVASHDLQEPLRTISSYLQLLQRRYRGKMLDETADEFIAYAVEGATRMQTLIKDVLAYSRIGTRGSAFAPVDCAAIVGQVLTTLGTLVAEQGARVRYDALPVVCGDAAQLSQIFQNLIGNALKFRGEAAPDIAITAERAGSWWVLRVADNGIGIDPVHAEQIFEVFKRLHTRDEYAGTGIGLAICKKIVERHGGRIWVESQPGQGGATFLFTVPADPSPRHP